MEAFQFYSPTQIIFGRGTEEQVGEQIARRGGSRVLVVYGGQSAVKSELLSRVLASLEQSGLSCDTLGGVSQIPDSVWYYPASSGRRLFRPTFCWPLEVAASSTRLRPSPMESPTRSWTCGMTCG